MNCIHCGGRVETTGPEVETDDSVLATLVEESAESPSQRPSLCAKCAALLSPEGEPRAEFYCLWCRRPLSDDGKTPRRDAAPLAAQSDECVMFRECVDCAQNRGSGGSDRRLEPRPR